MSHEAATFTRTSWLLTRHGSVMETFIIIGIVVLGVLFILTKVLKKEQVERTTCPSCGKSYGGKPAKCPHCGEQIRWKSH